jgi:hypothetical protein
MARIGLLIKMPEDSGLKLTGGVFSLAGVKFDLQILCPNESAVQSRLTAAGPARRWFFAKSEETSDSIADVWEHAHETLRAHGAGYAPESLYIEPDFEQSWLYDSPIQENSRLDGTGSAPGCSYHKQKDDLPMGPGFAWHLQSKYSALADARKEAYSGAYEKVRIGIMDVGFDFGHKIMPENLQLSLQRNFSGDGNERDASDPNHRGAFQYPGHGTGTIGLLAGNKLDGMKPPEANTGEYLGGAPLADIIPVRIAESVILLRTSAFAQGLDYLIAPDTNPDLRADVLSMSMGGVASKAWAEVVNRAYDAGIVLVTAAGNNKGGSPQRIVFPARFQRVLAACGVMANGAPYVNEFVPFGCMAGNYGPDSKMGAALSAYTPNTPWAAMDCSDLVDMDGAGTSSATPQIAAAAALWLHKHKAAMRGWPGWKIVEATRFALFKGAKAPSDPEYMEYLGRGCLNAKNALAVAPDACKVLSPQPLDNAEFPWLRILFGFDAAPRRDLEMLCMELTQLEQRDPNVEKTLYDSSKALRFGDQKDVKRFIEAAANSPLASPTLKHWLKGRTRVSGVSLPVEPKKSREHRTPEPPARRLRVYAFDPILATRLDSINISEVTLSIPWESGIEPGPSGEYLEVVDYDPATEHICAPENLDDKMEAAGKLKSQRGCFYAPVNLDDPRILATEGLTPSTGNPKFHQQMVYAVAMRTIDCFEKALGRRTLWSPRMRDKDKYNVNDKGKDKHKDKDDSFYVPKLRIYPHALREANAYYDPEKKALLFGYFPADDKRPDILAPGETVFTCLSSDIIAHETTHALLDGIHRSYLNPSNPDVRAFHEAFADTVALLQHFSLPDVLRDQIARTRGELRLYSIMGELAQQFGVATEHHGALRSAIGHMVNGVWTPLKPDPALYNKTIECHDRGAILVAAIFDAFLAVYERRVADLLRIATGGAGVLPAGAIHPDLVNRLSEEAAKIAQRVLTICVRALDYLPPVDVTFSDYLRALITADADLVREDRWGYRVAFVEAFRKRGIYPPELLSLAVDTARWSRAEEDDYEDLLSGPLQKLKLYASEYLEIASNRELTFNTLRRNRAIFHEILKAHLTSEDKTVSKDRLAEALGIRLDKSFEVRSLQFSEKIGPEGSGGFNVIISLIQTNNWDKNEGDNPSLEFEGGCTIIGDLWSAKPLYFITKNVEAKIRRARQNTYLNDSRSSNMSLYFGDKPKWGASQHFAMRLATN